MYNLNILLLTLNDESIPLLCIYTLGITAIIYMATKKVKIKKEIVRNREDNFSLDFENRLISANGLIFNREKKIPTANYTLAFENAEVFSELPTKKVSAFTKSVLGLFSFVFIITPFYSFVETLRPVEYYTFMCCLC